MEIIVTRWITNNLGGGWKEFRADLVDIYFTTRERNFYGVQQYTSPNGDDRFRLTLDVKYLTAPEHTSLVQEIKAEIRRQEDAKNEAEGKPFRGEQPDFRKLSEEAQRKRQQGE